MGSRLLYTIEPTVAGSREILLKFQRNPSKMQNNESKQAIQINTDTAAYIPQLRLDCRFEKMSFGNANTNITDMKK